MSYYIDIEDEEIYLYHKSFYQKLQEKYFQSLKETSNKNGGLNA